MSRHLPEFPNFEYLKKQAKVLLQELRQRDPKTKLAAAQRALARDYGFTSWAKLKAQVESMPRPLSSSEGGGRVGVFARYTEKARQTIFFARYFAGNGALRIEAEHLMLALIRADAKLILRLLGDKLSEDDVRKAVERHTPIRETSSTEGDARISSECRRILDQAAKEADRLGQRNISTGHFLLGFLVEESSKAAPLFTSIVTENGLLLETARDDIARFVSEEPL